MLLEVLTSVCLTLIVQSHPIDKSIINWVHVEEGEIPKGAIFGGHDKNGNQYVGIGHFNDDWIPGKYVPVLKKFYVAYNKSEHVVSNFKVMTLNSPDDDYTESWKDVEPGVKIWTGAFEAAVTNDGDTLYVGRRHMHQGYHIGKVSLWQMKCFIPYDNKEHAYEDFEVLIISQKIKTSQKDKKIESNIIKGT